MRYIGLYHSGELLERVRRGYARLRRCDLCPHACGVNRLAGETGVCGAGILPRIASVNVHRGEEPPISGIRGSGAIFFSGCPLHCRFCQNFPISQLGNGNDTVSAALAASMVRLQSQGAHNINLVTPTHFLPQILASLFLAVPRGFTAPIVWNSSGYERVDALELLDGIVDIYLPDMKYAAKEEAAWLSAAPGYPVTNREAVKEMLRQVGHLTLDESGIAARGLIIRHLVLPEGHAGSEDILRWIGGNLGRDTHVSLMKQFFPAHEAAHLAGINRKLTEGEYADAVAALEKAGLENGWVQE